MTIFWAGCLSAVLSFLLVKKRRTLTKQVICNLIMLLAGCGGMLAAGMQTTSVLVYIILFVFTVLGVLTRIFAPAMLNFTGRLLAKLRKQSYNEQTYERVICVLIAMYIRMCRLRAIPISEKHSCCPVGQRAMVL